MAIHKRKIILGIVLGFIGYSHFSYAGTITPSSFLNEAEYNTLYIENDIGGCSIVWYADSDLSRYQEYLCGGYPEFLTAEINWETWLSTYAPYSPPPVNLHFVFLNGSYALCDGLSYAQCVALPEFVNDARVIYRVPAETTETSVKIGGGGVQQFYPHVSIEKPKSGDIVGFETKIKYKATDENDLLNMEPARFGLIPSPVSLFYSNTMDEVAEGMRTRIEDKKLIQSELSAEGVFTWNTKNVPEGDNYRIIGNAIDLFGDTGEFVTGLFSIDHTPPQFIVTAEPTVSRGEDVKIMIQPSEELVETPEVYVAQTNTSRVQVFVQPVNDHFEGVYRVFPGLDGSAHVTIIGRDRAGNVGEATIDGVFSVGIEPPPKPIITEPLDKAVMLSDRIVVRGSAREGTEVILTINGKDEYRAKPSSDGSFEIKDVRLGASANRGVNFLRITAQDPAGGISEAVLLSIKRNESPTLEILAPQNDAVVFATTTIRVSASDANNDVLRFTYEISNDGGQEWFVVKSSAFDISRRSLEWDTREFPDGAYRVRVIADDGFATTTAISDPFIVRNFLPAVTFDDGEQSVINVSTVRISGSIQSPANAKERNTIVGVEYSVDGSATWRALTAADGAFNSFDEKFSLTLNNQSEGEYTILFRAKDRRGFYGKAKKSIIVDFGPPATPVIGAPASGARIANSDDLDPNKAGVQIAVSGRAEPRSTVMIVVNGSEASGVVPADGVFSILATIVKHKQNTIHIFATDRASNKSPIVEREIIYNNPPEIVFLNPRRGEGINHRATVKWRIQDLDLDPISGVLLSYRKTGEPFQVLSKAQLLTEPASDSFDWDVSDFAAGTDYEFRLQASDGIDVSVVTIPFSIDNVRPTISVEPFPETRFRRAFTLKASGNAADDFSGIYYVEYATDGEHWYRALVSRGLRERNATFTVDHPIKLEDGTYDIGFRAVDGAGNVSESQIQRIRIDTMPPRIGSSLVSVGSLALTPSGDAFVIGEDAPFHWIQSLESDTAQAELMVGSTSVPLIRNATTGLWEAEIAGRAVGDYEIALAATDTFDNHRDAVSVGRIQVIHSGRITDDQGTALSGARVTVLTRDESTQNFVPWEADAYGLENPVSTDDAGRYHVVVPTGSYQLLIQRLGFGRIRTSPFDVGVPTVIHVDFSMRPRTGLRGTVEDVIDAIRF